MATQKKTAEVDYSMQEKILALYDLQKIDSQIDSINKVKGELPLEVQDLDDELAGLKARVENINAEIEELNALSKQRKREVDQAKILIGNYKEQQNNVRNNREFDAISKEIEYQELEIELAEKRLKGVNEGDLPYEDEAMRAHAKEMPFPIGQSNDGFAQYFSGKSFLAPVSTDQVGIFNVTFEPGCRNNWHIHHAKNGGGQILVCVAGRGYYQEEGKEAIEMKPGDCINIPPEVKHWHGAAPDSWFSHLAVEVPGEETSNEWCEPVSDEEYGKLK